MNFESVAIASYPRSGNTWMRHLLFHATGMKSRYNLNPETAIPHKAGAIHLIEDLDSPLVKTHDRDARSYQAAIHLTRNPIYALSSYLDYCRVFAIPIARRREFLEVESRGWLKHTEYWRMAHTCGILQGYLTVRYEDLVIQPEETLEAIVNFLGVPTTEETIRNAVAECALEKLQERGTKDFFPEGGARMASETLTPDEIKMILFITEKERKEIGYF